jgi:hypothetical protein
MCNGSGRANRVIPITHPDHPKQRLFPRAPAQGRMIFLGRSNALRPLFLIIWITGERECSRVRFIAVATDHQGRQCLARCLGGAPEAMPILRAKLRNHYSRPERAPSAITGKNNSSPGG